MGPEGWAHSLLFFNPFTPFAIKVPIGFCKLPYYYDTIMMAPVAVPSVVGATVIYSWQSTLKAGI